MDHLDVEYDAPYMYNVNTALPKDIDKYKEFTVTDTLESVLAIADTPVAYVDGRDANGALETSVEGNTVTVKVKDFARLKGFKEIQLYIPAKLKAHSDLTLIRINWYQTKQVLTSRMPMVNLAARNQNR